MGAVFLGPPRAGALPLPSLASWSFSSLPPRPVDCRHFGLLQTPRGVDDRGQPPRAMGKWPEAQQGSVTCTRTHSSDRGVIHLAALPASLGQGQLLLLSLHHSSSSLDLPYFGSWSLKRWEADFLQINCIPFPGLAPGVAMWGWGWMESSPQETQCPRGARGVHGIR